MTEIKSMVDDTKKQNKTKTFNRSEQQNFLVNHEMEKKSENK